MSLRTGLLAFATLSLAVVATSAEAQRQRGRIRDDYSGWAPPGISNVRIYPTPRYGYRFGNTTVYPLRSLGNRWPYGAPPGYRWPYGRNNYGYLPGYGNYSDGYYGNGGTRPWGGRRR